MKETPEDVNWRFEIYTNKNGVIVRMDKQTGQSWCLLESTHPKYHVRWIPVFEPTEIVT